MKKLILLLLFVPLVSLGQSNRPTIQASDNERWEIVEDSDYLDILLDRQTGNLWTNNNRGITQNDYLNTRIGNSANKLWIYKVRANCGDGNLCPLAQIKNGKRYKANVFKVLYKEELGYVMYNSQTAKTYVQNQFSYSRFDNFIQSKSIDGDGNIPYIWKVIVNCPEGEWCEL